MGFYSGLAAEKYDRQYSDRVLIKRLWGYFTPHKRRLVLISILIIIMSLMGSGMPIVISKSIDLLETTPSLSGIALMTGIMLLIGIFMWLANWGRRLLTMRTIATVIAQLATDGFDATTEHDLSFFDEFSSGRIVSRITSDTREFGNLVVLVTDLISQIFEAVILGIVLVNIDWILSLYLFAMIPIVFFLALRFRKLARKVTQEGMRAMATVNATIKETVSGISVAKNFRQEAGVFSLFDHANKTSFKVNVKRGLILTLVYPILNAIGGIITAVIVYFGGLSALAGVVTVGAWYLFLLSEDRFMFPVQNLSAFWTQVQTGLSAAERVFALIDADPAVIQTGNINVPPLRGKINFENVNFNYKDGEPVLSDFSLSIREGESVALVGHTGAGKSSIVKLIARFYEYQSGKILVDGYDLRELNLGEYRKQLGIVSQVPFLFSETILENIRYGRPGISEDEIEFIACQIGNGDWL
ncbi:MAG: ABC transporter ATP-binding protein/permease, partial [Anaerolineaceae bacterium]|nr:ABC transporter ATP-binding protein/permease [Anaerolineaceae bacterium]